MTLCSVTRTGPREIMKRKIKMHQPTPHPPPLLFLKKGDMSLSVEIAPLTSLLLGGLTSLSFPKYKLGSRA